MFKYKYYDTPEGQDIFKKTFYTSKIATVAGLGMASFDVLMYSHPVGLVNTVGRYMFYLGPLVGMATAFTVTTNVAQNFRGKNDRINYFLGGAAAGSITGAWARSLTFGVPAAVLFGIAGMATKIGIEEGWDFFPDVAASTKSANSIKHDWTLVKDVERLKNWTTGLIYFYYRFQLIGGVPSSE